MEIRQYRNWKHWPLHSGSARWSAMRKVLDKETGRYRKVEYGDIVILLRSATGWAEPFSQVLTSKGIPVYSASQDRIFLSTGSRYTFELSESL